MDIKKFMDALAEFDLEDTIVLRSPDYTDAIIGISSEGNVIYDYDLMVKHIMQMDGSSREEAEDFVSYNTIRALPYMQGKGKVPIILTANRDNIYEMIEMSEANNE